MIIAEVEVGLENARDHMRQNPAGIRENLKLLLEAVQRAPDLTPEVRSQLSDRIVAAIRESEQVQQEVDARREQAMQNEAIAREQGLLLDSLHRDEERVVQLMARFNSLLDERQYGAAEEAAAISSEILPDNPVPNQAIEFARLASQDYRIRQLVAAKQRGYLDNLYNVETSAIPFPDEPPIVYPDGDWWMEMSERRAKYALSRGLPRHSNRNRCLGAQRRRSWHRHSDHPRTAGHHPAFGPAADLERVRPHLHGARRSAHDHHPARSRK
jgi:hypothetical protein